MTMPHGGVAMTSPRVATSVPVQSDDGLWPRLQPLVRLMALKQRPDGRIDCGHWRRGSILYRAVAQAHPRHILEIGTGRGYASLCMAQAARDGGFACDIWTIDQMPPQTPQELPIDVGDGPRMAKRSMAEIWEAHVDPALRERVHWLTGDSGDVLRAWEVNGLPRIDLCFIDGGHDYWSVKRDFLGVLRVAHAACEILFDDYTKRRGYGVWRLIDRELQMRVPADAIEVIDTGSLDETVYGEHVLHKMAWLHGDRLHAQSLRRLFSEAERRQFAKIFARHQRWRWVKRAVRGVLRPIKHALAGRRSA